MRRAAASRIWVRRSVVTRGILGPVGPNGKAPSLETGNALARMSIGRSPRHPAVCGRGEWRLNGPNRLVVPAAGRHLPRMPEIDVVRTYLEMREPGALR